MQHESNAISNEIVEHNTVQLLHSTTIDSATVNSPTRKMCIIKQSSIK